jgi:hypothetical protein
MAYDKNVGRHSCVKHGTTAPIYPDCVVKNPFAVEDTLFQILVG